MADNINVLDDPHLGTVPVATDEIGGVHYPVYKLAYGTDGSQTPVDETNKLPVEMGDGDLQIDAWGVPKVSLPVSIFHGLWTYDIPQSMWFMYHSGTQVYSSVQITSTNGAARLLANGTVDDVLLESRECPRYQPNRGHLFSTALWCPNATADGVREWGLATIENGIYFRLKSDGLLYAVRDSGSAEAEETAIDTSGVSGFDVTKGNIYDIQYQWRGVGNYNFFINNTLVYTMNLLGTLSVLTIENPTLPVCYRAIRTNGTVEMYVGCADITSENGMVDKEQYISAYSESVSVATNTPVIVMRNPLQADGMTNTRTSTLARISVNCSKKAVFKVWTSRTAGDITGATYKNIGGGSFLESDSTDMDATAVRATAVTIANLRFITAIQVEATQRIPVDNPYRGRIEFPLVRGDYLIVTCTAATANADCVVELGDQV